VLSATEVSSIIEAGEGDPAVPYYGLALGDGDSLVAIADALAACAAAQGGDASLATSQLPQLAVWLEDHLTGDEWPEDATEARALFQPFSTPAELAAFLDPSSQEATRAASVDLTSASSYIDAILNVWQPAATVIVAPLQTATPDEARGLERLIVATCGACAAPMNLFVLALAPESAYQALAAFALSLASLREHLTTAASRPAILTSPTIAAIYRSLASLVSRKLVQLTQLAAQLPGDAPTPNLAPDRFAAIGYVGALCESRANSLDLQATLAKTLIPHHKFTSLATKAGLQDPLTIDQNPRLARLRELQQSVDAWITEALTMAGREPTSPLLDHEVDRISITLGALQTQLGMLLVTEALLETDPPNIGLWEDLEPIALELESALGFLGADVDYAHAREAIPKLAGQASLIVTSFKWSALVFQAMRQATDIVLTIETGKWSGGIGPSLRNEVTAATGTSGAATLTSGELDRFLLGLAIVAKASKADLKKWRNKGIKAETGLGLSPNRPRDPIPSLTGTASVRYPDKLGFRTFWEIKNVLNLRLTRQLTDFMLYAQSTGLKMRLYIRPAIQGAAKKGTTMSPALTDAIRILKSQGLIEVRYLKIY
jgi:hypothetical protein